MEKGSFKLYIPESETNVALLITISLGKVLMIHLLVLVVRLRQVSIFSKLHYVNIRNILFNSLSDIGNIDIDALLFGKDDLTYQDNEKKNPKNP